jgi:hypothetical protein
MNTKPEVTKPPVGLITNANKAGTSFGDKYLHSFCKEAHVRKPQKATILKTCPLFLKRNRSLQVITKSHISPKLSF